MVDRNSNVDGRPSAKPPLRPLSLWSAVYATGAVVVLAATLLLSPEANSQEQVRLPANRAYPWHADPDIVRLSDRFAFDFGGDESGPTSAINGVVGIGKRLNPDRLTDREVASLAKWPSLRRITVGGGDATPAVLRCLSRCTKLEYLDFFTGNNRGFDGPDIEPLERLKHLHSLVLLGRRISPDAMKHIGRLQTLDYLCFGGTENATPVRDDDLVHLGGLNQLRELDLSGTKLTAKGLKHLMPLQQLRDIGLLYVRVREADLRQLARLRPKLHIASEDLWVPAAVEQGDHELADAFRTIPDLARLARHNARVEVRGDLAEEEELSVVTLYLDDTDLSDSDLVCLAKWPLQWVTLGGKNLTAGVLQNFRSDVCLESLTLHLVNRGFEPKDIEPLEGKEYLYYLCLEGNSMPASVMERIGRLNVMTLDLTDCPVTDDGLVHLASSRRLTMLSLAGSKITASGLKHLISLRELESLDLANTTVTKADVESLHRALPKLRIIGEDWEIEPVPAEKK